MAWGMEFTHIFTKNKENNISGITNITNISEIIVNLPYIKGVKKYFEFINETFFNELFEKKICKIISFYRHDLYTNTKSYGYACDSNSKLFIDKLNNEFPDLILYNFGFNRNFTLTKSDLFAYNTNDISDSNLYFLIVDGIDDEDRWILGIPFLKKYVISYDYDNKRLGFYKNYGEGNEDGDDDDKQNKSNNNDSNLYASVTFKVLIIILSVFVIFVLGMLFQRYLKKDRKKRANELDDEYDYTEHKEQTDIDEENNKDRRDSLGVGSVQ